MQARKEYGDEVFTKAKDGLELRDKLIRQFLKKQKPLTFWEIHFGYDTVDVVKIENTDARLMKLLQTNECYKQMYREIHEIKRNEANYRFKA